MPLTNLMDVGRYVRQGFEQGRERGTNTRLNQLAGQAYGASPEDQRGFVQQAMQTDRTQGMALGADLNKDRDAGMKRLGQQLGVFTKIAKAGNQQMVAGMYPQLAAEAKRLGFPVSDEFDPNDLGMMEQIAATYADSASALPSGLREFNAMTEGLSPEDRMRAQRVSLGLDGRAATGGMGFQMVKNADGTESMGRTNPRNGVFEVYNAQTGQFEQLGGGMQGAPQPQPQPQGGDLFASLSASVPGLQVTSGQRTPERNAQVGGVPNSFHLTGQAQDFLPPNPQQAPAVRQWAAANNMEVIDEGDHWHMEPRGSRQQPRTPGLGVSRRPEDQAALTTHAQEQAKNDVAMANYRQMTALEAERTAATTDAKSQSEQRAEAIADLPKVAATADSMISVLQKAINHPGRAAATGLSSVNPLNQLPGSSARDFAVVMDQLGGKAFLQAFESLKGGGQITEVEGKKATEAMGRLSTAQSEGEFLVALQDLLVVAEGAKNRAIQRAAQGGQARDQAPSTAIKRARNPQTGAMLELRNGQWVPVQ